MWNTKVPDEIILQELISGMSPEEVRDKHGLSTYWGKSPRAHRLVVQASKERREQEQKNLYPVTTYHMSPEEIERRYGRKGEKHEQD